MYAQLKNFAMAHGYCVVQCIDPSWCHAESEEYSRALGAEEVQQVPKEIHSSQGDKVDPMSCRPSSGLRGSERVGGYGCTVSF